MAKLLFPVLACLSAPVLAGGLPPAPAESAARPRVQLARLQAQQQALAEEMGRLQLELLVSEIVEAGRPAATRRPQLTLAVARR